MLKAFFKKLKVFFTGEASEKLIDYSVGLDLTNEGLNREISEMEKQEGKKFKQDPLIKHCETPDNKTPPKLTGKTSEDHYSPRYCKTPDIQTGELIKTPDSCQKLHQKSPCGDSFLPNSTPQNSVSNPSWTEYVFTMDDFKKSPSPQNISSPSAGGNRALEH